MILPIVKSISELRKPNGLISNDADLSLLKRLIGDLKDTLATTQGVGLAACQIGIHLKVAYINLGLQGYTPFIIVNPKIVDKFEKVQVPESCLSFPGIQIITDRYKRILVEYHNEKLELKTTILEGLESIVFQHEYQHCASGIFLDSKHKAR